MMGVDEELGAGVCSLVDDDILLSEGARGWEGTFG